MDIAQAVTPGSLLKTENVLRIYLLPAATNSTPMVLAPYAAKEVIFLREAAFSLTLNAPTSIALLLGVSAAILDTLC